MFVVNYTAITHQRHQSPVFIVICLVFTVMRVNRALCLVFVMRVSGAAIVFVGLCDILSASVPCLLIWQDN